MNESLENIEQLHSLTISKITTLLSHYIVPEYNALFSGMKKLAEKAYASADSSVPMVVMEYQS